ncbi:MAG: hypothetical protein ACFE91_11650 [Promethearchaeota archaeon]
MSHIRRNRSRQIKTSIRKKKKKRMTVGLMIIAVILLSIIIGIVYVSVSTP